MIFPNSTVVVSTAAILFGVIDVNAAESGIASVYSYGPASGGERVKSGELTAAHRSLPFGTKVRVTNRRTGRSVVVRINDRGPFVHGRIIDVTPAAAQAIGLSGLAPVTVSVVGADNSRVVEQIGSPKRGRAGSSQPSNGRSTPVNVTEAQPSHAKAGVRRAPRDPGTERPARTLLSRDHRPTADRLPRRNRPPAAATPVPARARVSTETSAGLPAC
jgi:rare lipoprotein A